MASGPEPFGAVHECFERQAALEPDAVAVVDPTSGELTYRELNRRANQVAHHLRSLGVGPDVPVGLCVPRCADALVGMLGILKAGGAYVPLDPAYPPERLEYILSDTRAPVVVTYTRLHERLPECPSRLVHLDSDALARQPKEDLRTAMDERNLAYVIYTSGSTGKPKGTMIEHRSLASFTRSACRDYALDRCDRVLQFASINFDASVEEIYPTLACGATLVLRSDAMLGSIEAFVDACRALAPSVLNLPTAYWHQLASGLDARGGGLPPSVRLVIIGGEAALAERVADWRRNTPLTVRLVNTYGPTEATVVATRCELTSASALPTDKVPIGRATREVQTSILGAQLQPVPAGSPGELYLGGAGLARGYLDRPDLTADRFIPDPFSQQPGARLYRTGDLACCRADGNLEFLGRTDHQVKVRGFRVELGEIEATLGRHPAVQQVVVVAIPDESTPGERKLVAYLVVDGGAQVQFEELRSFLAQQLPEYMLPSGFVMLTELPLTSSGKIDRAVLPSPEEHVHTSGIAHVAPRSETEEMLVDIWQDVLGVAPIGVNDNFFDLGGYSLKSIQVMSRVRDRLGCELPPLNSLLEAPTVAQLAELIIQYQLDQSDTEALAALVAELTTGSVPWNVPRRSDALG